MHAAGFLHRDIKPDNVYISADNGQPVLLDFGAARLMDRDTHTLVVSHGYAPPEQYQSRAPRTPSADLYAVGATIYRCMTGFPPPPADVRSEPGQSDPLIPPGVAAKQVYSPALIAALERTLRLAPADRPQSVAEFRAMLVPQYQSGDVHRLHKANSAVRPFRQWGMIATLAAIAIAFAVFVMERWKTESESEVAPAPPKNQPAPDKTSQSASRDRAEICRDGTGWRAGCVFRDCANCPEMVVIPAGTFKMGNPSPEALDTAVPQHPVTIVRPFALGKYEVTFAEWDACFSEGSCAVFPNDSRWGRARRPVMNVSWSDAKLYIVWLQKKTGQAYRLPSEAEWEYAARARTTTPYSTGPSISTNQANYDGKQTLPVGSFAANAFGLHDMHGNVVEWVEDCFKVSYHGAPSDGRAWLEGDCSDRVVRGGSYNSINAWVRSYYRLSLPSETRRDDLGFRLARTLD